MTRASGTRQQLRIVREKHGFRAFNVTLQQVDGGVRRQYFFQIEISRWPPACAPRNGRRDDLPFAGTTVLAPA